MGQGRLNQRLPHEGERPDVDFDVVDFRSQGNQFAGPGWPGHQLPPITKQE